VRYLSVCSGIEAATVAWHPLGWTAAAYSEIEAFPRAVLTHHYPDTPLHGDFTTIGADEYGPVDLLVGGTPCQSFSVAGLRGGLADERGNLALEFLRLAHRTRARWVVWENVPGVLSSDGGRDFGSILGGLVELGYGYAYRVLDAQFFGVPQRRRRVFVVGYLGDWRASAAVLLERHSLSGHPAPRRAQGQVAPTIPSRNSAGGGLGTDFDCDGGLVPSDWPAEVCGTLDASKFVPVSFGWQNSSHQGDGVLENAVATLDKSKTPAVAFTASEQANSFAWERDVYPTLNAQIPNDTSNIQQGVRVGSTVRRLTPRECERLQGFPDDYTLISYRGKPAADGPRYKALGNSMAVPVMSWIGERIARVEALQTQAEAA
jgi:DNA (cytosine-5)-methyltransferase 1